MKRNVLLILLMPVLLQAQRLNVRVLSTMKVSAVNVSIQRGNYQLFLDGVKQHDS